MISINKETGFTLIYEGTKPYKTNTAILKTITLNPEKYDCCDLPKFRKDFSRFIRTYGKKNGLTVKYLVIPEQHAKGGWHMHGFLRGIPPDNLRHFTLCEKLPIYLRKRLEQGFAIYDWIEYREHFGFCDIEPVRNLQAASAYVTKYITKSLDSSVKELGGHLYYASQGLNRASVIKTGKVNPELILWDFENEYVKIKIKPIEIPEPLHHLKGGVMQDEIKNLLQFSDCHSTLTTEGIAELYKFMQKEDKLKEVCNLDRIKILPDNGRNYIYINRKQLIGIDRADLINKLYYYF